MATADILVVDDDLAFRGMLVEALSDKDYAVDTAGSAEEGLAKASTGRYDLVLTDVKLPGLSGLDSIPLLLKAAPLSDVIVMTAYSSKDSGLEALKRGAYDYFTKPFSLAEMEAVIRRAVERRALQAELKSLRRNLEEGNPIRRLIGQSEAMLRVEGMVERVAELEVNVLITGESGTGKELVADVVHALSTRSSGPFVKINCAAIPDNLLESELFGHEKGAFTGALNSRPGKFELAQGGSILLDEIGDMPLHLQPKLLRAVEQKMVERVGGGRAVSFDARIIAATNQDLAEQMAAKKFRGDLYYRLNVAAIHLPPLRERRGDLPLLARHFLDRINGQMGTDIVGVSPEAMRMLTEYDWPGNVRQFANTLERAAIFCRGARLSMQDVEMAFQRGPFGAVGGGAVGGVALAGAPSGLASGVPVLPEEGLPLRQAVQDYEKSLILAALQRTGGVQTEAAKLLGISAKNLWNKLQKHGVDPDRLG
jgi:two-component system response regulator AtoC